MMPEEHFEDMSIEDYFGKESTYRLDLWLDERMFLLWRPWLNGLMITLTDVLSPEVLLTVAFAGAGLFLFKRKIYEASLTLLSSGGGLILGAAAKWLVNRPRPASGLILEMGQSFPSQHSLMAVVVFSLLLIFYSKRINRPWLKFLFILTDIMLIISVGFSRLYLRVHWFSDCLAGFALGLFWLTLLILVFRIVAQLRNSR